MLDYQAKAGGLRIIVLPDHATPVSLRTHHAGPVPYGVCGPGIEVDMVQSYSEKSAQGSSLLNGPSMFEAFIRGTLR